MIRFETLDQVKGVLLVVVTLGHAFSMSTGTSGKELWYFPGEVTSWVYYFPRFIGHPIAIGFATCMGIGMVLLNAGKQKQGWSERQVMLFFIQRGSLLVLLQFTLANIAWALGSGSVKWNELTLLSIFGLFERHYYFGVLYMLGSSMVLASMLIRFSNLTLLVFASLILASPFWYLKLLDAPDQISWVFGPLGVPGGWEGIWVLYTIIPWLGFALTGMLLGRLFLQQPNLFVQICRLFGFGLIGLFVVAIFARAIYFGHDDALVIFQLKRYPPDLFLMIFGLGFLFSLFSVLPKILPNPVSQILGIFGKATLFFYLGHLFLYAVLASYYQFNATPLQAYVIWIIGLVLLLPLCKLFLKLKTSSFVLGNRVQKT